ncbi:MAG: asparagine synthase C-terminal domain-containing protein, partial [Thiotrichales bacterium]|nr:asparagine synthase C-terminal domain-containing protein [Thiotrichales bacterium]
DEEFDESGFVNDTIRQTGAELHRLSTDPNTLWGELGDVLAYHDEPVHSATALVGYKLMQLAAKNGVKVVLNGQGADETLAGYPSFFRNHWATTLLDGAPGRLWKQLSAYSDHFGSSPARLFADVVQQTLRCALCQLPAYRALGRWRRRRAAEESTWLSSGFFAHVEAEDDGPPDWRLDDALKTAVNVFPLPLYLRVEDRNSMAHSVEARLPFLDYRLVEYAFSLPGMWKMNGALNKYVLRESMRDRIPESVRARTEKFGFPTPINRWVRQTMRHTFEEALSERALNQTGLFATSRIRRDLERHLRGEIDVGAELFNVVQFQRWLEISRVSLG